MLKSMTGYGEACCEVDGLSYAAEIRSVNNRYFKASLRLPESFAFLESEVEKLIKDSLSRGSVNYSLRLKNISSDALYEIDTATLKSYVSSLTKAAEGLEGNCQINLADMVTMPGVIVPFVPDQARAEKMKNTILEVTAAALNKLMEMRIAEGKALEADLSGYCDSLEKTTALIAGRSAEVVDEYREKLKKRVDDLLASARLSLDEQTLHREVAVYADRCDISEEVARLGSHVEQFRANFKTDNAAGRRLDFICQELLREANTIGSKAGDSQICQWVVDLKCTIEKIKEQVQNVE